VARLRSRIDAILSCAASAIMLAGLAITIAAGSPFGYDESVYAVLARHWVAGTPASGWDLHRPPLLSILGVVPAALGATVEWPFRLVAAPFALALLVIAWRLARSIGGIIAGIVIGVVVISASSLHVEGASFLTDVPSTAVLLAMVAVLWRQLAANAVSRGFLWLAPLAATAFYLRYGAVIGIGSLALAAVVVAPAKLWVARRTVLAAAGLFLLLLLPHVMLATLETGSPWGMILRADIAAGGGRQLPLLDYLGSFQSLLGPAAAAAAVVGALAATASLLRFVVRRSATEPGLFAIFGAAAVALQLAILGTQVHAEPRYVFFPVLLLAVVGAATTGAMLRSLTVPNAASIVGAIAGAAVAIVLVVVGLQATLQEASRRAAAYGWVRDIGQYVRRASAESCSVLTADVPIVTWYSGCPAINFAGESGTDRTTLLTGAQRYVVLRADGHLQPSPDFIGQVFIPHLEAVRSFEDGMGHLVATLYRVE
jgi:hypothetical protein